MAVKKIPVKAREEVEIRGTRQGLVIALDATVPAERLANTLRAKLAAAKGFFSGASCELLWYPAVPAGDGAKAAALAEVLDEYGLTLRGPQTAGRETVGLPEEGCGAARQALPRRPATAMPDQRRSAAPRDRAADVVALPGSEALLYRGILRGGQSLCYPGNVVIMGHVNPGAVVEAGGHVLVLGRLAGTVRAGWPDNRRAVIVAWYLASPQVAVAGHYLPADADPASGPRLVRLYRGKLRLEEWQRP